MKICDYCGQPSTDTDEITAAFFTYGPTGKSWDLHIECAQDVLGKVEDILEAEFGKAGE